MRRLLIMALFLSPIFCTFNVFPASTTNSRATQKRENYDLVLYTSSRCPYCKKVANYLAEHPRKITIKNVDENINREELKRVGGKTQIPCLVINGKALYESDDIIQWLKEHP